MGLGGASVEVDVTLWNLTVCDLLVSKSRIQLQSDGLIPSSCGLLIRVCRLMVLNAAQKSNKSSLT